MHLPDLSSNSTNENVHQHDEHGLLKSFLQTPKKRQRLVKLNSNDGNEFASPCKQQCFLYRDNKNDDIEINDQISSKTSCQNSYLHEDFIVCDNRTGTNSEPGSSTEDSVFMKDGSTMNLHKDAERNLMNLSDSETAKFKKIISIGPVYVCSCCTQTWFREGVQKAESLYVSALAQQCLLGLRCEQGVEWLCHTCYRSIKMGKIPSCAIYNGFGFPSKPPDLEVTEMEERLISPRIPFMQLMEKPRGGQKSLRGNVVNVPSDVNSTVKCLPRTLSESETVQVKLKRKISFKNHVLHEAIRPKKCLNALKWLLQNSELFRNEGITINENWDIMSEQSEWFDFNEKYSTLDNNQNDSMENLISLDGDGWTEDENFDERLTGNTDTLLHPSDVRSLNKVFSFAPGENQTPLGLYQDPDAEYLAFPTLYCGQRRPNNKDRHTPVTYSTICKWELRSLDRRAACCMPNLFFKLKKVQIKQIQDKVALAMRKCKSEEEKITVGQVLNDSSFDKLVRLNEGYRVLRTLRGSPAYWENAKKDIFAMIRQLGVPTWFCSFSAAETKWTGLLRILSQLLNNRNLTDEEIHNLSWIDKCELIKRDPVTCARYFSHRFQTFLTHILKGKTQPLGEIRDYFCRVEFQQRGSPHIHMLIWIKNAPKFEVNSLKEIQSFIDKHSTCAKNENIAELINYQTHRHARTCKKKGQNICRFNFPLPPMSETTILKPLEEKDFENNPEVQKNYTRICEFLNNVNLGELMTFETFLQNLEMSEEVYIMAIRSSLKSPKVFLKRQVPEIRVNSYNEMLLKSWEANIDVQFILDSYACAAYIVSYLSKSQRGMSNLLHEACEEARKGNLSLKQQVRQIGNKFLTHVEISAQEAAYLLLQIPLRLSSRTVVFINTNELENRTFLLKPLEVLQELPDNSTNIQSDNWIKRYQRRPKALEHCCLADFVSKFDIILPPKDKRQMLNNEYLPENELEEENDDDLIHGQTNDIQVEDFEKEYPMTDGSILKHRRVQKIIRFVRFNKNQDPENYFREQLMLFLPWRNELSDLKGTHVNYETSFIQYQEKVLLKKNAYALDKGVADIVEDNMLHISVDKEEVIAAEVQHSEELDLSSEKKNCMDHGCFIPESIGVSYDLGLDLGISRKQVAINDLLVNAMDDRDYIELVRSLNVNQKFFFYHVLHKVKTKQLPLYCFLSGGAGVGKSVLTTCLYQSIVRFYFKCLSDKPDEIKVVLCAPTGKAAFNIHGQTIHSLFCIPANQNLRYTPLDVQQLDSMRVKFRCLRMVFIDEISMVGNKMFNFINMRLQEIFANDQPFGGISIVAIGDLFQLKPVFDGWIFENLCEGYGPLAMNLWGDLFKMYELTEIMRQKEDKDFAELLNRLREGLQSDDDVRMLCSRQDCLDKGQNPDKLPHLFTTNVKVNDHNMAAFRNAPFVKKCVIPAIDFVSGDVANDVKHKILNQMSNDPSKTMGLFKELYLVEDLPAEICINIDVNDGLTNGTPCIVKKFDFKVENSTRCSIVWVQFELENIGASNRMKYSKYYNDAISKSWTPILEVSKKFTVGRNKTCHVCRRQFPLRLACAKTIHKAQGSTMKKAVLDLGKRKQEHLHYVGLSRVRSLQDLHILELNDKKIAVSPKVIDEMRRLREHASLSLCLPNLQNITSDVKIVFHNSRSLHKHIEDLKSDINLTSADIIAISESRLNRLDIDGIYEIPGFYMFRFDGTDKSDNDRPFHGMVVYSKIDFIEIEYCIILGIATVFASFLFQDMIMNVAFLYCPPKFSSIANFTKYLQTIMQAKFYKAGPVLILGDTNIDFNSQKSLTSNLRKLGLRQLMHSSTTDYDTCLDHVYSTLMSNSDISCATLDSYYSDHKPIVVYLPK
ncbi:uncharacterized protein LOC133205019 [Saccostrea echinata]|uniref:uncharacterized protein LOC133205019 n=1 Tax=Saccostrea echinata TaxID=191078 RepID=UPI002A824A70|nr:uncharacterized protein LOC133205019 [Saccostrea echinata]